MKRLCALTMAAVLIALCGCSPKESGVLSRDTEGANISIGVFADAAAVSSGSGDYFEAKLMSIAKSQHKNEAGEEITTYRYYVAIAPKTTQKLTITDISIEPAKDAADYYAAAGKDTSVPYSSPLDMQLGEHYPYDQLKDSYYAFGLCFAYDNLSEAYMNAAGLSAERFEAAMKSLTVTVRCGSIDDVFTLSYEGTLTPGDYEPSGSYMEVLSAQ